MTAERSDECDIAVIGGGPAGLAAATELRRLGAGRVLLLEREAEPGGIPRHCGHYPFGMRELGRVLRGPDYANRIVERALAAGVGIRTKATVTALGRGPALTLSTPEGVRGISAGRVLIATGAREASRAQRLIGGTKPGGVLSTGALQGLVYLDRMSPFRHPVVLGTELVSFSALLTCRHAGIRPVAMIEPNPRITAWPGSWLLPRSLGVPLHLATNLTRIFGTQRVEAVEVQSESGGARLIETDGVVVTGRFVPESPLVRDSHLTLDPMSGGPEIDQFMRLSDPHYFAAGNVLRPIETAGWCWSEGQAAARMIAASLAGELSEPQPGVRVAVAGPALKLAVPQRIVHAAAPGALDSLQLRVSRPVRGKLTFSCEGRTIWSQRLRALPERRILLPLERLGRDATGEVVASIEEQSP